MAQPTQITNQINHEPKLLPPDVPLPDAYAFYESIGKPRYICAPMVDQSELPFRLLCKKYGTDLCYTPMIHSRHFIIHEKYRRTVFETCKNDFPVVAQFCANDPKTLLQAVSYIFDKIDAIDLNFGCPQGIARRGNYGAFLLDQQDIMFDLITSLYQNITLKQHNQQKLQSQTNLENSEENSDNINKQRQFPCQIAAKIRVLSNDEDTIKLCKNLVKCGISILTVHGRTRDEKKQAQKHCNWDIIRKIKLNIKTVPIFANGGCQTLEDVEECLKYTGCDGYMAAESLLSNPAMFLSLEKQPSPLQMSIDYLFYTKQYPQERKTYRAHLFKMLYRELSIFTDIRTNLGNLREKFMLAVPSFIQKKQKILKNIKYQFKFIRDRSFLCKDNEFGINEKCKDKQLIYPTENEINSNKNNNNNNLNLNRNIEFEHIYKEYENITNIYDALYCLTDLWYYRYWKPTVKAEYNHQQLSNIIETTLKEATNDFQTENKNNHESTVDSDDGDSNDGNFDAESWYDGNGGNKNEIVNICDKRCEKILKSKLDEFIPYEIWKEKYNFVVETNDANNNKRDANYNEVINLNDNDLSDSKESESKEKDNDNGFHNGYENYRGRLEVKGVTKDTVGDLLELNPKEEDYSSVVNSMFGNNDDSDCDSTNDNDSDSTSLSDESELKCSVDVTDIVYDVD